MSFTCERCGFPTNNINKLIKHLKEEIQCRPIKSKTPHAELIAKLQPPPSQDTLTCNICQRISKTIGGMKTHMKSCQSKHTPPKQDGDDVSPDVKDTPVIISPTIIDQKRPLYLHKNTPSHKHLHAFTSKNFDWESLNISDATYIECCQAESQGIVDLFVILHNIPEYANIKWHQGKLIIFDGKGWTEALNTEKLFTKHLGNIYSVLEEKWCDYLMNVRTGNIEPQNTLCNEVVERIDEFFYTTIVDDESVYFHCKDSLDDYLETLKST